MPYDKQKEPDRRASPRGVPRDERISVFERASSRVRALPSTHEPAPSRVENGNVTPASINARGFDLSPVQLFCKPDIALGKLTPGNRELTEAAGAAVQSARNTPGAKVPPVVRTALEHGMGADFSAVRVHAGPESARAARLLSARAFTVGNHMHFAQGAYDPASARGRELIAHEAVHTLQSRDSPATGGLELSAPADRTEIEADRIARDVAGGARANAPITAGTPPQRIHRAPDPLALEANRVTDEMRVVIADATWKEIRKRVYPKASAPGIARAQERHAGNRPDLTGLGKLASLDRFAQSVRQVQSTWTTLRPGERLQKLGNAANAELTAADVPGFSAFDKQPMEPKAFFLSSAWSITLNEDLLNTSTLPNDDAALLANATLHESRHAEQQFLAARYEAGVNNDDSATIAAQQQIPDKIAEKAVKLKFNASTDANVRARGQQMFAAMVTDQGKNQQISDDSLNGIADLKAKRAIAVSALNLLNASVTSQTITDAKTARDDLKAQMLVVEQKYLLYRNIPYEADAHEVGDAAELAFKGWPTPPGATSSGAKAPHRASPTPP